MRIAIFIKKTTFHKGYGGLETQNKLLCEGLAQKGYDVTVFSPKNELNISQKQQKGVSYIFVDCVFRTLFSSIIKKHWYKQSYKHFNKMHSKVPFDLIISQSSAGIGIIKKKKEISIPIISISHGSALMEYKTLLKNICTLKDVYFITKNTPYFIYNYLFKQRFFIRKSNKVVTVSKYVANTLMRETKTTKDKYVVINNAIAYELTEELDEKDLKLKTKSKIKKLLYLGQIQKSKGLDALIELANNSKLKDIQIDVVGSGPYLPELKNKVKKLKIDNKITFYGKVSYDKVTSFYKNSYIFLFPTNRYEGFPMVLVEAMFNYLPIVSYNMGGVNDAIENNKTGYLVKPKNINKFTEKIYNLLKDEDLYIDMSKKSYNRAINNFELNKMIKSYINLIESTINENT